MREPILIINFKTYESGTGKKAGDLAKICGRVAKATGHTIIAAAQAADMLRTSPHIATFAQHIDPVEQGKNTGFVTTEAVIAAGAKGTLLNHAEHKIPISVLAATIERCRGRLITVACAANVEEARAIAKACSPDYIAIEVPELIGGSRSVSNASPEVITGTIRAVHSVRKIPIICGAGISGREDVEAAIRLGSRGVLVANYVMSAKDQQKAIQNLANGL
ncbi:triosephosphate isomerase [Candidatus Woesearchaeota archaeon]|nr:triosephosphate isomerase [Candidatus Woesearchaeota archaeon]